jgi:NADH-quinone oxidoreductase subunit F
LNHYRSSLLLCTCTMCVSVGALEVKKKLEEELEKHNLQDEIEIILIGSSWLCTRGPTLIVRPDGVVYQYLKAEDVPHLVEEHLLKGRPVKALMYVSPEEKAPIPRLQDIPFYKDQRLIALWNRGIIDPDVIEEYIARDGYRGLLKALKMTPEQVVQEIKSSGLRGRGGAGFSTGLKWELCRRSPDTKRYLICNADEGDPGAFMDRSIIEADPHSLIEGMLIGGYAISAQQGYVYIRIEYPLAIKRLTRALAQAREAGLVGKDILGTGFDFDIEIFRGAGAFVCGEETALIFSIEGEPAEPRQRPPFPVEKGLFGHPTVINNVETFANVPRIINFGAEWFSAIGTEKSKGTKVFSLAGDINNAGLVEVPMGITLREMIYDIGGGIPKGKKFKAVQIGGPSGGVVPSRLLDLPVDYERLQEAGVIMGSGGMIIADEDTCMVDLAKYFLKFTNDESCGKCTSCREGSQAMLEVLSRISEGNGREGDIEFLTELGQAIKDASQCGLGQTLPNPVLSTLTYFRDEYEAHIKYKKCPAVVCRGIISSPCQYLCPIGQNVPAYVAHIARGEFDKAVEVVRRDNPLPLVCGRVCHHPCETRCKAGEWGDPIAIRALKRFVSDYEMARGIKLPEPKEKIYTEKVAIVGSGPAGLTCGYYLAQSGYDVTIFEAESVPGGMLSSCIPEYRLPRDILAREIEGIEKAGVRIQTGRRIDDLDDLKKQGFKAIFVATGAHKGLKMGIPGENTKGVLDAVEFLKAANAGKKIDLGDKVAVIGGGNAAIDAARTALRLGSKEVTIIYRRTKNEMPADPEEVDSAIEEGIGIQMLAAPVEVISSDGKLKSIKAVRMRLGEFDASGRRRPLPIEGSEYTLDLDSMIYAISQEPDLSFLKPASDIKTTKWNTVVVDPETYATNQEGVFAGGDVASGPATVTEAMAAGKIAAGFIHKYLRGRPLVREYKVIEQDLFVEPPKLSEEEAERLVEMKRAQMPALEMSERRSHFKEVLLGLAAENAVNEARRCLRCDQAAKQEIQNAKSTKIGAAK